MKGEIVNENACALILSIIQGLEPEQALRKMDIKLKKTFPQLGSCILKKDQKETVEAYYYGLGMSLTDIAKLYDCSRYTVMNFMKTVGIPIKPRGRYFK